MPAPSEPANAAQIDYWNSEVGARWAANQQRMDAMFAPLTEAAIAHADPQPGGRVLDVGCGSGTTVLALAGRVGPTGRVLGVDVSRPMLDLARRRTAALPNVRLERADAAAFDFAAEAADGNDLLFSRFGVMFFDDPPAAFAHLRGALRSGGRLAFITWRAMPESSWFAVPLAAVRPLLPPQPPPVPDAPGPFAFADPDRVRGILQAAGFAAIAIAPLDARVPIAAPGALDAATDALCAVGPVSRALADATPEAAAAARAAVTAALAPYDGPDGVTLGAGCWLVSARA